MKGERSNQGKAHVIVILIIIMVLGSAVFIYFYVRNYNYKAAVMRGDYEKAIQLFPRKEEAYITYAKEKLYEVAYANNYNARVENRDKAIEILSQGYEKTKSQIILEMLDEIVLKNNNPIFESHEKKYLDSLEHRIRIGNREPYLERHFDVLK